MGQPVIEEHGPVAFIKVAKAGGALSWSFTTIAVAAKNVMSSVPDYLLIETAFTAVQWAIVGPLTAFVSSRPPVAGPALSSQGSSP